MRFTIGFEPEDTTILHGYWDDILRRHQWTDGYYTRRFEDLWGRLHNLPAVGFANWSGAAMAALEYFSLAGKTVLCPSNTFMATPLATIKAGAGVVFVDCNRDDLCLSLDDLRRKADLHRPAAVWLVHIGGHIAFQVEEIAAFCRDRGIILLEDCAHAHGADYNGRRPGTWGDAGVYSFYATKTVSTGEGGMLVSGNPDLIAYAKSYRDYGKPDFAAPGLNHRMNEFSAAIGCLQTERLPEIVAWKNDYAARHLDPEYPDRVKPPAGMRSGLYKYIVFTPIPRSTGKVYDQPCHRLMGREDDLPNTEWVAANHWCVPLYYKGDVPLG